MTARIAVVDDDPIVRESVASYLRGHQFQVAEFDGGPALRQGLKVTSPDLIVLDLVMPEEDGLSVLRWLRGFSEVPVIMLTGNDETTDRIVGLEVGADDYVGKPCDMRELLARIHSHLRRVPTSDKGATEERLLATVLFTYIAQSTQLAVQLGDAGWRELLGNHHEIVRAALKHFHGSELDTAGDGFFAVFDAPARALRCARVIQAELRQKLQIEIRAGLHTGECERMGDKLSGLAVHIGARIMSAAKPGEVLASSTVKDLVAGSGLKFRDAGTHTLKGVPGEWPLFALGEQE
ncbi:MAG: response regulator [Nevskiales bacterium]